MLTHYLHIGLYRARLSNSWEPTSEIYTSEDDAERDLPSIENYQYTLVVPIGAQPKMEDWSDRLAELERDRKLEAQYERGLVASAPGARR